MAAVITAGSVEHIRIMTIAQLRTLAASTDPAHIAAGFAAQCELVMRGADA